MSAFIDFEKVSLSAIHTSLTICSEDSKRIARVSKVDKLNQDDANTYVRLNDMDFHNGVIEVDV